MALKAINTLIKLHKRRVDVLRRELVALEEERRQLQNLSATLRAEHQKEMELSVREPKMAGFFGPYSQRIKQRLEAIAGEIKRLDTAIEQKIEAVREEFSEQKKYDIAGGHIRKRMEIQANRREQQRFDEIAGQQFSAHQGEEGKL